MAPLIHSSFVVSGVRPRAVAHSPPRASRSKYYCKKLTYYSGACCLLTFLCKLKCKIPKTIRGRGNPVGDFGPLVLGSRLFEFHGLGSGFEVVGSNPGQPAVVHFLHFAVLKTPCAGFCFFRRNQLILTHPAVRLMPPDSTLAVKMCSGDVRRARARPLKRRFLEPQALKQHESSR